MPIYASGSELVEFMFGEGSSEQPPANAHKLLRKASGLVRRATRAAVYPAAHETGLPIRARDIAAFREATCAQAAAWSEANVDPGTLGSSDASVRRIASKSLGSASTTYEANAAADEARNALLSGDALVSEAWDVLDAAGLLSTNVQSAYKGYGHVYPPRTPGTAILGDDMILGG